MVELQSVYSCQYGRKNNHNADKIGYMENKLNRLAEFQEILGDYHISNDSKAILNQTKLVFLISVTAGGRNTIISELLKNGDFHYIVSDTTRHKRINNGIMEQDGQEYWFRSENEILADLKAGKFLEAAIIHNQQVSGISIRELTKAHQKHKIAINEIEIVGMHNIVEACPGAIAIFVLPPSFEEWMKRLDGRGDMPKAEKKRRLQNAILEFDAALKHDYYKFVINNDFHNSVDKIIEITNGNVDIKNQNAGIELVKKLQADTINWVDLN